MPLEIFYLKVGASALTGIGSYLKITHRLKSHIKPVNIHYEVGYQRPMIFPMKIFEKISPEFNKYYFKQVLDLKTIYCKDLERYDLIWPPMGNWIDYGKYEGDAWYYTNMFKTTYIFTSKEDLIRHMRSIYLYWSFVLALWIYVILQYMGK